MRSLASRTIAEEQMDAPDLPAEVYRQVLADLAKVNRLIFSSYATLGFLKRALDQTRVPQRKLGSSSDVAAGPQLSLGNGEKKGRHFRLLDVGFGQGDMLRSIARWAGKRGIQADLVGVDLNPNSEIMAREATEPGAPIRYLTGDYRDQAGGGWDFVISSLVTHHMTPRDIIDFLRFMEAEARVGWMVNDLLRHRFAYHGFPLLARIMGWHRIVREDGQLSIARSFRPAEWRALLGDAGLADSGAEVVRRFSFRLCVERIR